MFNEDCLDMLRITYFLEQLGNRAGNKKPSVSVINLAATQKEELNALRKKNTPLMINLVVRLIC